MSRDTCHISRVTCHVSHVTISIFTKWSSYLVEGLLSNRTALATTGLLKITSLLRRLQAQTLPDAAPPIGKIHPFSKMAASCEPMMRFGCPNSLWIYMTLLTVSQPCGTTWITSWNICEFIQAKSFWAKCISLTQRMYVTHKIIWNPFIDISNCHLLNFLNCINTPFKRVSRVID